MPGTERAPGSNGKPSKDRSNRGVGFFSKSWWAGIGAIATIGGTIAAVIALMPSDQHATSRITYQPTTLTGQVSGDLHVTHKVTGYCDSESIAAPRQGAYRCVAGNGIYDPCFAGDHGGNLVVCPYPSPDTVTVMQLTRPLPVSPTSSSLSWPWLLTLADGEQCWQLSGATTDFAGMPLNYRCGNGNGNLYGTINKTDPVWTIFELRNGSSDMTQAAIAKAYF